MLVVTAQDSQGKVLSLLDGSVLPEWTGNYARSPGKVFAKILRETYTNKVPSVEIWRPIEVVSDTRLAPFVTDNSHFTFRAPVGTAKVQIKLIYRRSFQELMKQKGWSDPAYS